MKLRESVKVAFNLDKPRFSARKRGLPGSKRALSGAEPRKNEVMPVGKRGLSIRRNFSKRPLSGRIPFAPIHVPTRPSRDWTFHVSSRRENDFSLVIEQGALHLLRRRDLSGCAKNSTIPRYLVNRGKNRRRKGLLSSKRGLSGFYKLHSLPSCKATTTKVSESSATRPWLELAFRRRRGSQNEVYPVFWILLAVGNQLLN